MSAPREYEIVDFRASSTKADGTPLVTKTGNPMWRVDIQIAERPGVWINGLVFKEPTDWKGTKQKLSFYVETYNGREIPKFKLFTPRASSFPVEKFDEMIALLRSIDSKLGRAP